MSNLEMHPGGFNMLRRMYETVQQPLNDMPPAHLGLGDSSAPATATPSTPNTTALPNPWSPPTPPPSMGGFDPFGMMMAPNYAASYAPNDSSATSDQQRQQREQRRELQREQQREQRRQMDRLQQRMQQQQETTEQPSALRYRYATLLSPHPVAAHATFSPQECAPPPHCGTFDAQKRHRHSTGAETAPVRPMGLRRLIRRPRQQWQRWQQRLQRRLLLQPRRSPGLRENARLFSSRCR